MASKVAVTAEAKAIVAAALEVPSIMTLAVVVPVAATVAATVVVTRAATVAATVAATGAATAVTAAAAAEAAIIIAEMSSSKQQQPHCSGPYRLATSFRGR